MWKLAALGAMALASTDVELVTADGRQPWGQLVSIDRDSIAVQNSDGSAQHVFESQRTTTCFP